MRVDNYTAHVVVDGEPLEEHHITFVTPTRAECWIVSEHGKTFSIQWQCHTDIRTKGSAGWVRVDGSFCGGASMYPGPLGDGDTAEMSSFGSGKTEREFMFSCVELGDDDELLNKEVPSGFGQISLEIEHGKLKKGRGAFNKDVDVPDARQKFHERSNKAGCHRVGFGPTRARRDGYCVSYLDVDDQTSIFFIFKYKPIDLLQADGLVPRPTPPDPSPSPEPEPNRSRSPDTLVALAEEIRVAENKLKRLRELEASLSKESKPKKIKTENSDLGILIGKRSCSVPDIIDLTGTDLS